MHDVVLNVNEGIPAYLSILHNDCDSPFSDDEFQLPDSHLNGLVLGPDGLEISEERMTLRVSSLSYSIASRSLMMISTTWTLPRLGNVLILLAGQLRPSSRPSELLSRTILTTVSRFFP